MSAWSRSTKEGGKEQELGQTLISGGKGRKVGFFY